MLSVDQIAKICHNANRDYCLALGDTSQVSWEDAPDWQRRSAILGVELHRNNPDAGPSASHESWMQQKLNEGWVYGEIKDAEKLTHPCIVPYEQLSIEQKAKDYIFRSIVLTCLEF